VAFVFAAAAYAALVSTVGMPRTALAGGVPGDSPGAVLAMSCSGCHGAAPTGADGIPSLTGLSADEIADKLEAYRSGEAQGTLMNRLARGYTKDEIRQLAEALGSTPE
jgi:sulfide dehydrogenase cytochrome subunit